MSQKLPISNYKFVSTFNKNKYGQSKSLSCLLNIGQMEPEFLNNPIQEAVFLSSKSYSYICKNDILDNKHKMKNKHLTYKKYFKFLFTTIHRS